MPSLSELQQLAGILNKNKLKYLQPVRNNGPETKLQQLYLGLAERRFAGEEEAARAIYGKSENHPAYRMLKSRLYDRMINSIFIIDLDPELYTPYQKAYYRCHKDVSAVKILLGRYARQSAIRLAEKTLKQAIRFELTDVILDLSKLLRFHYSHIAGDKKNTTAIIKKSDTTRRF